MRDFEEQIRKAVNGKEYWEHIYKGTEYILLLPEMNENLNYICKCAFQELLKFNDSTGKILSVSDGTISETDAEALISLYSLYCFTDRLIIGSLDRPYGRRINNLLMIEGMTLEKAVRAVLFRLGDRV